ncbi:hypothetical protein MUU49_19465 [Scandinavium goeteborgense]|uniref:hypothetical protein n=1 Tax=Scandinavium goeteborgense TaxID=1851514 RepID=UPI0021664EDD|nr:hypothetical protein [Scandinavium goeteborgense]MCS2154734.1 hypothetical protein [Scandinavium goeteborgense]
MSQITALPVDICPDYGWTHPAYAAFCNDREYVPTHEFNDWLKANGLHSQSVWLDIDDDSVAALEYEVLGSFGFWEPEMPEGDGWFVGSIHDTDDGPVCVWLRQGAAL